MPYYYFDDDRNLQHVVVYHDPSYDPASNGARFVHHPDYIEPHRVHAFEDAGALKIRAKDDLAVTLDANPIALGAVATFRGVPEGAAVSVNGAALGIMEDAGGVVEVAPEIAGLYRVRIELHAHVPYEVDLEVRRPA